MTIIEWIDAYPNLTGLLAPHAVLSMFERGRSDALGVRIVLCYMYCMRERREGMRRGEAGCVLHERRGERKKRGGHSIFNEEKKQNTHTVLHTCIHTYVRIDSSRYNVIQGPDRLEELMAEGCMFVVARVDGYR